MPIRWRLRSTQLRKLGSKKRLSDGGVNGEREARYAPRLGTSSLGRDSVRASPPAGLRSAAPPEVGPAAHLALCHMSMAVTGHRYSAGHTRRCVVSLGCEPLPVSQISASLRLRWLTAPSMVDEVMQAQLLTC